MTEELIKKPFLSDKEVDALLRDISGESSSDHSATIDGFETVTEYETRTMALLVIPKGQPLYSERGTTVSIVDESGGEFVEVEQHGRTDIGKILINAEEWPALRDAIEKMIKACRDNTGQ